MSTFLMLIFFGVFLVYHAIYKGNDSADIGGEIRGQYSNLEIGHDDNEE